MAIAPTGALYKGLIFDGIDSRDFGIYITGAGVYDAPVRSVEMIEIPGRNGAYALDRGRFENIEVTYPAGTFAETEEDFAQGISDFRNAIASRTGYRRLEDDYNPDEYREAIFKSGLAVAPAQLKAGEFSLTFECKPQRFLKSGEDPVTIQDGDTLDNPTLFDASPLLMVWGEGAINIEGQEISIDGTRVIGSFLLAESVTADNPPALIATSSFDQSWLNAGDAITVKQPGFKIRLRTEKQVESVTISDTSPAQPSGSPWTDLGYQAQAIGYGVALEFPSNNLTFQSGTGAGYYAAKMISVTYTDATTQNVAAFQVDIRYTSPDSVGTRILPISVAQGVTVSATSLIIGEIEGYSTKPSAGSPAYIDLDLGEAYIIGQTAVSINDAVSIGAALPVLKPGGNTINFDNTITQLQILPRWWKV